MTPSILVRWMVPRSANMHCSLAISMAKRLNASLNLIHVHSLLDATCGTQVFDNTLEQELPRRKRRTSSRFRKGTGPHFRGRDDSER